MDMLESMKKIKGLSPSKRYQNGQGPENGAQNQA